MAYVVQRLESLDQTLNKDFIVATKSLNIRKEPRPNAQIVGRLSKGDRVRIFTRAGDWGSTVNGWVFMKYLREEKKPQVDNNVSTSVGKIEVYEVLLPTKARQLPFENSQVLFELRKGDVFSILGKTKEGTWALLEPKENQRSGWVALDSNVRLLSSLPTKTVTTRETKKSQLPLWIPRPFRETIEKATNWIKQQVLKIFGKDEKQVEETVKNLTIQYEAVERLIREGKVKADSILVQTQQEVRDFLAKMKSEAQKFLQNNQKNENNKTNGLNALPAIPISIVVLIVSGLAAGVITLQTIQRMRQVEVQRESELRKFKAYEEFKKTTGGTSKSAFEALLNSTAQPVEPQKPDFFASLSSGLQSFATILLVGAGGYIIYNLIQQKK